MAKIKALVPSEEYFHGHISLEQTGDYVKPWRIPFEQVKLFPPDDRLPEKAQTLAGVRVVFKTDADTVGLTVQPLGEPRHFDLTCNNQLLQSRILAAEQSEIIFDGLQSKDKTLEIWLPQRNVAFLKNILVPEGAAIEPVEDSRLKWVTYGSSITHCGEAHSPARTWPALVARKCDLNLTCLGFGGDCHLEPMMARLIRDLPANFISMKLGINVQGGNSLNERTFGPAVIGLIKIVREKHAQTPMAIISPIISPPRETEENEVEMSLTKMRDIIADCVQRLRDYGDSNLFYFDGLELFGAKETKYMPDELHPDGDGQHVLADNFIDVVYKSIRQKYHEFPQPQ